MTFYAISDLCTDTGRDKYPVARPDVRTDICVHTSASPSAADKNDRDQTFLFFQDEKNEPLHNVLRPLIKKFVFRPSPPSSAILFTRLPKNAQ